MPTDTEHYVAERPVSEGYEIEHGERNRSMLAQWSPAQLVGLIEVGFGVLLIVASVVPGGIRSLIALLGAVALSFGIVVVSMTPPDRLNHWLGVEDKNGWFFVV